MFLTISVEYTPASDVGFLFHKNPNRFQSFSMNFGKAYVFYPEVTEDRCTIALLLDIDPIEMVRGRESSRGSGLLDQYVNDRPYAVTSFMSVAVAKLFSTAMQGRCSEKPELAGLELPVTARLAVLPVRGGEETLHRLFDPLGYEIRTENHILDENFSEWGASSYYTVELKKKCMVKDVLSHLYVLIPVLDNYKHYYISDSEVDKLLTKGEGWLGQHPEKEFIIRRYLKFQPSLARQALSRLAEEDGVTEMDEDLADAPEPGEKEIRLNEARMGSAIAALKGSGAKRVIDIGCGEGRLLRDLLRERQFEEIVGMDVSVRSLERANEKLKLERLPTMQRERIRLFHGSLMYRDSRLSGFDAAAVIEVIEHLDPPRLVAFERVLFEFAKPQTIVLTTPNREYNVRWENVGPDKLRHGDHRFEWTRGEFQTWAKRVADKYGYGVRFLSVGTDDPEVGPPTQMAVFAK